MDREIDFMLRMREEAERVRGRVPPRPRLSRSAVVEFRPLLNAPALADIMKNGTVHIVIFESRATQHVLKKCQEHDIETIDARLFKLWGGMRQWMPRHTLLAPREEADEWMNQHYPRLKKDQLPWLLRDDPGARYHGAQVGEVWSVDTSSSDDEQHGGAFPPRIVVEAEAA